MQGEGVKSSSVEMISGCAVLQMRVPLWVPKMAKHSGL